MEGTLRMSTFRLLSFKAEVVLCCLFNSQWLTYCDPATSQRVELVETNMDLLQSLNEGGYEGLLCVCALCCF